MEWIPRVSDNSPTGLNILAQGRAQRRPGYASNTTPKALKGRTNKPSLTYLLRLRHAPSGQYGTFCCYPGRRFATFRRYALPWAMMLLPHSGRSPKWTVTARS